ncbi:MAG TPA: ATP-binding protein [Opitutaceae bacterium]|nr:ATP-binding protein [Opitutaceae bacterium]
MSGPAPDWSGVRDKIIGLGEQSSRKSYYPELQKRLEDLRASEENLRTIFNSTHEAILIHDFAGRLVAVNEPMLALYRVSRQEALAFCLADYTAPGKQLEQLVTMLNDMRRTRQDQLFEWVARRPLDGTTFDVEVSLRVAMWEHREMVVAVVRDIGARKRAELERKQLEAQLAQSQKMESIGLLAGGVAHDFNNMLTPILNYAIMLREDFAPGTDQRHDLDEIVHAAERARDLTRQLLAFARKQTMTLRRIDLNEVVRKFEGMLRRVLPENIAVRMQLAPEPVMLEGDVGQLEQVLLNLSINARDAMAGGGVVMLTTQAVTVPDGHPKLSPGPGVCLSFSDTGGGMDAETLEKVFDPFFTTKGLGHGTGLGLSIVHGIVAQHGGHIEVSSQVGKGTEFRLTFRACAGTQEATGMASPAGGLSPGSETVLLVEDQDQVRLIARKLLERCGYNVLVASDGEAALGEAAKVPSLSLLVTDVIMPGMNGRELYEALRQSQSRMKVLYLSGYPADIIGQHGVLDAHTHFLQKPFLPQEFSVKVRQILDEA